jgi:hypothetical protein
MEVSDQLNAPGHFTPREINKYPLKRNPGGPPSWSEHSGVNKNVFPVVKRTPISYSSRPYPGHYNEWTILASGFSVLITRSVFVLLAACFLGFLA